MEQPSKGTGSSRTSWVIERVALTTCAPYGPNEKITASSVEIDIEELWRSSDLDGTHPNQVKDIVEENGPDCTLGILDTERPGMGFTGIALVVAEPSKHLTIDASKRIRGLKGRDDVRSGVISVPLEGFEVNGAIAAVEIATHFQRNGDMARLRSVGGGKYERDDSKDSCEREIHLCRQAELEDRRIRRKRNGVDLRNGLWSLYFGRVGPVVFDAFL
jgi:hypothetical protein